MKKVKLNQAIIITNSCSEEKEKVKILHKWKQLNKRFNNTQKIHLKRIIWIWFLNST